MGLTNNRRCNFFEVPSIDNIEYILEYSLSISEILLSLSILDNSFTKFFSVSHFE